MTPSSDPFAFPDFENQNGIGQITHSGSCSYDPDRQTYTICGAGQNIWGEHDDFHYVWRRLSGNFILTAQAQFAGAGTNPHRKLGWMARSSLDSTSPQACAAIHGDGLVALQFRKSAGGQTAEVRSTANGADVIQLERKGSTYILSTARFGETFTSVQVTDLNLGDDLWIGIFVCSHEAEVLETATFENVRIVAPVTEGFDRGKDPFGSRMEILDIASGHRQVLFSQDAVFEAPNWTRDGKALIFNSQGRLYRYDLQDHSTMPIDSGDVTSNNNDHVISFDGQTLAISSHGGSHHQSLVYTLPIQGGQPQQITPLGPSYLHGWSPDGKFLVYTGMRGGEFNIYRIPSEGGAETQLTFTIGLDDGPEYTPDGRYIYFNSVRSGRMQIWRMNADGSNPEQLTNDEYNNWFPHISPDCSQVLFISYLENEVSPSDHPAAKRVYLRLIPLNGGTPRVVAYLYGGQGTINVPSWSPDGKMAAFVSNTVPF